MRTVLIYLPAIACVAMVAFVCIPMMRNMHNGRGGADDSVGRREIDELREEIARLKAARALHDPRETIDG